MSKKCRSLKKKGQVPTIQTEPDLRFLRMLGNVELITYMKFQNILTTGCRDMGQKHQKYHLKKVFPL